MPDSPAGPGRINRNNLHELFRYHAPTEEQQEQYDLLRLAAYDFANAILAITPPGREQQDALRKFREAFICAVSALRKR